MPNRRKFIREVVAAGIASSVPTIIFSRQKSQTIRLLVRADDMGKTYDRNLAIIKAHKEGIVTCASVMPSSQFFYEAVKMCKANPALCAGLHITGGDSMIRSVLTPDVIPSVVSPKGLFYETEAEIKKANPKPEELEMEIRAQIARAGESGLKYIYLDNHRGASADDIIFRICKEKRLVYGRAYDGKQYGFVRTSLIPESWGSQEIPDGSHVSYSKPAQTKEEQQLYYDRLGDLKPGNWIAVVHPGLAEPQRAGTTELLCSAKTKEIIKKKNIQLVNYYTFWEYEYDSTK